ncbi:hypothetical protein BJF85_25465 [Saccharomonospora sp. CUA-673]|uniref:hypothetical protein n=1 Tax=Pseudonocardiaceae TaxID=2070 RepID=UPI00036C27D3|nr:MULTISPECIES: hypothetical protein [Pseudonocardiaceae]OLT39772.1 hypothetical protein BJF85_25465 [Saccharomonospora sp. CUA-673]
MTAVIDDHPALAEQKPDQRARDYRDVFAWPTTIDSVTGDVRLQLGTTVDALIMRAGFAGEVNNFLARHMLRAPIIVVPGDPNDWIFLTEPRTPLRQSSWDDLVRIQVGWKQRGDSILLPALDNVDEGVRWLEQPQPHMTLPPWTAVVGAVRSTSSLCGTW